MKITIELTAEQAAHTYDHRTQIMDLIEDEIEKQHIGPGVYVTASALVPRKIMYVQSCHEGYAWCWNQERTEPVSTFRIDGLFRVSDPDIDVF